MACVRTEQFTCEGTSRCTYRRCKRRRFLYIEFIRFHLYKDEFKPDYWVWIEHGETLPLENQFGVSYVGSSSTGGSMYVTMRVIISLRKITLIVIRE